MARSLGLVLLLSVAAAVLGCQAPDSNTVPWWRGIPGRLTSASSLEAEMWRRQHGAPGEGPSLPSRVIVGPLGSPGETIPSPEPLLDDADQGDSAPEKWDPKLPAPRTKTTALTRRAPTSNSADNADEEEGEEVEEEMEEVESDAASELESGDDEEMNAEADEESEETSDVGSDDESDVESGDEAESTLQVESDSA